MTTDLPSAVAYGRICSMTNRIRVAVVDDHPLFREGIAHVIADCTSLEIVGEGATADDARRIASDKVPDVMLLDVDVPGGGIEAARAIARACPVVKTIIVIVAQDEEEVARALAAGARGCVLKGMSGSELLAALPSVARGELYVATEGAAHLIAPVKRRPPVLTRSHDLSELTEREKQILDQVAYGLTNKEIATTLEISEKTVRQHMTNIMQKLRARNRVHALLAFQKLAVSSSPTNGQAPMNGSRQADMLRTGIPGIR